MYASLKVTNNFSKFWWHFAGIPTTKWGLYFWLCKDKNHWWRIEKPLTWV